MGYWFTAVVLSNTITTFFWGLIFAGVGAYTAEMITRKINTIEL
jgi:hypothetical protein